MPDITCPLCNKAYLIEDPNDWRDFVDPTGDPCDCDGDTKIYVTTDSSVEDGYFKCPEGPDCYGEPTWECSSCEGDEMVSHDKIIDLLLPPLMKDYKMDNWSFYTPTTLSDYFSNATEVWYEGCEHFGTYDETGCWNCLQEEQNVEPEAVHVTLKQPETTTRWGKIIKSNSKDSKMVTIDLTPYINNNSDISRSDGALWISDGIGLASPPTTQRMLYYIIINRTNIR
jgi:hypothetical protein